MPCRDPAHEIAPLAFIECHFAFVRKLRKGTALIAVLLLSSHLQSRERPRPHSLPFPCRAAPPSMGLFLHPSSCFCFQSHSIVVVVVGKTYARARISHSRNRRHRRLRLLRRVIHAIHPFSLRSCPRGEAAAAAKQYVTARRPSHYSQHSAAAATRN